VDQVSFYPLMTAPVAGRRMESSMGHSDPALRHPMYQRILARLLPSYDEEGQMNGVRVSSIKEGSMYEKMGLNDGDVIKGLNGIEITNPSASSKVLGELQRAETFKLTVMDENGAERVIERNAEQIANMLTEGGLE